MKYKDIKEGVGRITKQNQTVDVGPNEISIQAAKFGNSVDKDGRPPTLSKKVKGKSTNVLFNLGLAEGYKLRLERDKHIDVLHILDTKTKKRIEVRGKKDYETNYDASDKLHQVLDSVGKAANISELMNGEVVGINPKHPQGADAEKTAKDVLTTESLDNIYESVLYYRQMKENLGEIAQATEIYVDMDGVLADFFGEWAKLMKVDHYSKIDNIDINVALQKIRDTDEFWLKLPLLPQAKQLLSVIKQIKGEYNICSSPLADDPNSEPHKREWIKKNLAFFPPKEVIITHNKPQYATQQDGTPNILIDDFGKNVDAWEAAGGTAFKYKDHKFERTANAIKQHMQEPVGEGELLDKPTPSIDQLAKRHGVDRSHIIHQVKMGIEAELEHTSKKDVALEIALDHVLENPDYYTNLKFIENFADGRKNEGAEITMWTNPEYQGADVDDKYYKKQPVKIVDVSKLTPFEPADKMDPKDNYDNMMKFVDKIKAGEKVKPIVIVPHEGKLLIVDGHHRYFAHKKAGVDKIRAVIADPKDLTWRDDVPESVKENFAEGYKLQLERTANAIKQHMQQPVEESIIVEHPAVIAALYAAGTTVRELVKRYGLKSVRQALDKLKNQRANTQKPANDHGGPIDNIIAAVKKPRTSDEIARFQQQNLPRALDNAKAMIRHTSKDFKAGKLSREEFNKIMRYVRHKFKNQTGKDLPIDDLLKLTEQETNKKTQNAATTKAKPYDLPIRPDIAELIVQAYPELKRIWVINDKYGIVGTKLVNGPRVYKLQRQLKKDGYPITVDGKAGKDTDKMFKHWLGNVIYYLKHDYLGEAITENFADGKKKGKSRPGRVKKSGASCNGSVTELRAKAKNASGERAKMYHWCANMKSGRS